MTGMNAATGRRMSEDEHIRQSCGDILKTPIGSRVMRREYGSLLPELIDHPAHGANRMRLMSATVMALLRWEPRIAVTSVSIDVAADGKITVDMQTVRRNGPRAGAPLDLAVPIR